MAKRIGLVAALLVLAASATSARAHGPVGFKFNIGGSIYADISPICGGGGCGGCGAGGAPLGPWYNYWPFEAHFNTPAMPEYPYWPAMGTAAEAGYGGYGGGFDAGAHAPPSWGH